MAEKPVVKPAMRRLGESKREGGPDGSAGPAPLRAERHMPALWEEWRALQTRQTRQAPHAGPQAQGLG